MLERPVRRGTVGVLARTARIQVSAFLATPISLVICVVQPVALTLVVLAVSTRLGPEEATRRLLGVALLSIWALVVWSSGSILRQDRREGTLAALLSAVPSPYGLVFARSVSTVATGALVTVSALAVTASVLPVTIEIAAPAWFALALGATLVSGAALGMLLSTLFIATRIADRISEALIYPVFVLSGALVPLELLPSWTQWPSAFVSLRWGAAAAFTAASEGTVDGTSLALVMALGLLYLAAGVWALRTVIAKARRDGNLELS